MKQYLQNVSKSNVNLILMLSRNIGTLFADIKLPSEVMTKNNHFRRE